MNVVFNLHEDTRPNTTRYDTPYAVRLPCDLVLPTPMCRTSDSTWRAISTSMLVSTEREIIPVTVYALPCVCLLFCPIFAAVLNETS